MSKTLKSAIEANDPEAVRKALKGVKDINRKLPGGNKPLLYACEKGADKVLEVLFEAGAIGEKETIDPFGTPFLIAAEHGQNAVMERLWRLKRASLAAVQEALERAFIFRNEKTARFILDHFKLPITGSSFRLATHCQSKELIQLLVDRGGDINSKEDNVVEKGITAFFYSALGGDVVKMRILAECGARVNEGSAIGKSPLMGLATQLEWHERRESPEWAMQALETCLALGANAWAKDIYGNDAIDYCEYHYGKAQPNPVFIERLRKAGAKGDAAVRKLFVSIRDDDASGVEEAINAGADVNRVCPFGQTPLMWAYKSEAVVDLLLKAGADPNKSVNNETALMSAAGSGSLAVVKKLIAAGADIHTVYISGDYIKNAYSHAVMNNRHEVADYLKSLGAGQPKKQKPELLEAGVHSWNDFSELIVKTSVEKAAAALAKIMGGKVQFDVYGQSLMPGKDAFVVIRPQGMNWCNVFQIAPPRLRFEDSEEVEAFARKLAQAAGASVLSIEYSDTSDAASIFRAEPDGKTTRDAGWDYDTLQEIIENSGDVIPADAKEQFAKMSEDDPRSTERLEMLAKVKKFVLAAYGFYAEPGRKVEIDLAGYGAEAFDGVAFVSN